MNTNDLKTWARMQGQVERFHTWPVLRRTTLAEHSWRVATICMELCARAGQRRPSEAVLTWCLLHDTVSEMETGDIPHHVKRDHSRLAEALHDIEGTLNAAAGLPQLTPFQTWLVKLCDLLECWEQAQQEMAQGNRLAEPIIQNMDLALEGHLSAGSDINDMRQVFSRAADDWIEDTNRRLT